MPHPEALEPQEVVSISQKSERGKAEAGHCKATLTATAISSDVPTALHVLCDGPISRCGTRIRARGHLMHETENPDSPPRESYPACLDTVTVTV